jgi:CYTH domain-containing protein
MLEIERKFLVTNNDFLKETTSSSKLVQGYLNSDKERTVRIRIQEEKAFLTIKGKSSENGMSRFEWEKEIKVHDAELLLQLCEKGIISKTRHYVVFEDFIVEVDVFDGENEGLIVAEIELKSEDQNVDLPNWIGTEVTGDKRYYNSYLSANSFKKW